MYLYLGWDDHQNREGQWPRPNPTLDDHETQEINILLHGTFTERQWDMLSEHSGLEEWFQKWCNHQNGVN